MTISFTIDTNLNVVYTTVTGILDGHQIHEHQKKLEQEPLFNPNMYELIDCTNLTDAKLRTIVYTQASINSPWAMHAKRAIVVSNKLGFGLLRIFQSIMSDRHGEISIYDNIDDARQWLGLPISSI